MRRSILILLFVATGLLGSGVAARAELNPPEPIERTLSRIPNSAEMVVVMDGLSVARNMPAASALFDALNDLGITENLKPRWAAVAALLGWDETETLDRLMGLRVVLVASELENRKDAPWAILSEVSAGTAERLKDRIPAAPRKAVVGVPVFALERGEIEMAMVRLGATAGDDPVRPGAPVPAGTPGAPGAAGPERVMLLLGPSKRAQLFDQMAAALSRGVPDTLAGTAVVRELAAHVTPGVLVALRFDSASEKPPAHAGGAWRDFLVCTATPKGRSWECRVTVRDTEAAAQVRAVTPTSDAPYRAMSKGAMLAVLETRLAGPDSEASSPFERLLSIFSLPENSGKILTGRQALAVWPREPAEATPETGPAICCAFAIETSDVEKMAPIGDTHLGRLVAVPDFGGVSCHAVRSVPLQLPAGAPIGRVFDGPARIAWSYPSAPASEDAPGAARPGWWQVCVTGDGVAAPVQTVGAPAAGANTPETCERGGGVCAEASRQMVAALVEPPNAGETAPWISIGSARPTLWAPIVRMMVEVDPAHDPGAGFVKLFERIQRVEWRLSARDNGDIGGTMQVEMARPNSLKPQSP